MHWISEEAMRSLCVTHRGDNNNNNEVEGGTRWNVSRPLTGICPKSLF